MAYFVGDANNDIDFSPKISYGDMKFNSCLMYLEPRLQDYVMKKEYYTKNNISPLLSLEQQYKITKQDKMQIEHIFKNLNKKNCGVEMVGNTQVNQGGFCGLQKQELPACALKTSGKQKCGYTQLSRYSYLEGNNRYNIQDKVEDMARRIPPTSYLWNNDYSDGKLGWPVRGQEYDWKQVSLRKPMKYRLIDYFSKQGKYFPGNFIEGNNINQKEIDQDTALRPSYVDMDTSGISRISHMDTCYKVNIPGGRNNSCYTDEYLNTAFYKAIPYMGSGSGNGNTEIESQMIQGEVTRFKQKKTGGFLLDRFEFLDRDIQDPKHIVPVFPRGGVDTRAIDKYTKKDAHYVI